MAKNAHSTSIASVLLSDVYRARRGADARYFTLGGYTKPAESIPKSSGAHVTALVLIGLLLGMVFCRPAYSAPLTISVDTTPLVGTPATLAFDLLDGDLAVNNTAIVSGFTATGATLGSATVFGGVSGSLPGNVVISDTDFQNTLEQAIMLGTSFSFALDLTSNFDPGGSFPDSFAFFLLDANGSPVATDLLSDALFVIDFDGSPSGAITVASSASGLTVNVSPVPLPNTLLLVLSPLLLISLRSFAKTRWRSINSNSGLQD